MLPCKNWESIRDVSAVNLWLQRGFHDFQSSYPAAKLSQMRYIFWFVILFLFYRYMTVMYSCVLYSSFQRMRIVKWSMKRPNLICMQPEWTLDLWFPSRMREPNLNHQNWTLLCIHNSSHRPQSHTLSLKQRRTYLQLFACFHSICGAMGLLPDT